MLLPPMSEAHSQPEILSRGCYFAKLLVPLHPQAQTVCSISRPNSLSRRPPLPALHARACLAREVKHNRLRIAHIHAYLPIACRV